MGQPLGYRVLLLLANSVVERKVLAPRSRAQPHAGGIAHYRCKPCRHLRFASELTQVFVGRKKRVLYGIFGVGGIAKKFIRASM
jgi:hypothetical protein